MRGTSSWRLIKFAIVGGCVALFYVVAYVGLVELGLGRWIANVLAFLAAVTFQYIAQTVWTFRRTLGVPTQIVRFICMIAFGLLVSALITGVIAPSLMWPEWLAAGLVAVILPVLNFILFQIWVYRDPETY